MDLILVVLGAAFLGIFCVRTDAFARLTAFVEGNEAWQIGEAIIVLLFVGAASLFLFARRSRELHRDVFRRQAAELTTAELTAETLAAGVAERRFLEEAVRANEQRLQSILETAHQAIVTINQHGMVTGWNRHAELTFGWTSDEVLGRLLSEIIVPPELRAAHEAGLARYMSSRSGRLIGSRIEVTALRRNGDVFPIELALSATNIGEDWQFTALIQDISERRAQTELFENAFDHAPIGMALAALDGHLMKLNSAFCDLIGYEHAEATTLDFQTITHPDDRAGDLHLLEQLVAGDIPSYQLEKRFIRKSGRVVWVRLSASLVLDSDGAPKHLIAQIQDLSAERESEDRYRLLADTASDMVGIYSAGGRCSYMSPSSKKILGYAPEALTGKTVFSFMPPEERELMARATVALQAALMGTTVTHLTRLRHKDGHLVHIEIGMRMALGEHGALHIVAACRDVTARIEAKEALEERTRELIRANRVAEQSAAVIQEAQALFKGIFESSPDVNIVYELVGNTFTMNTMNEAAERSLGFTIAEVRGKELRDLFPPARAHRAQLNMEEAIALGEGRHTAEERTASGNDVTFDVRVVPLHDAAGHVRRVFVGKRDVTELKRAEVVALQANVLMHTAEKIAHMGYCTLDLITQEVTWSNELGTMLELDPQHNVPTIDQLLERRHPEDSEQAEQVMADAIANGAHDYESSYRLLLPSGKIRHILARGTIRREGGVALSVFGVLLDVSELRRAEEKARESDMRYRLMAENSSDVIVTSDLEGRTTFVSPSSVAVTGYTSEERMGHRPANITHPDDLAELLATFRRLKGGTTGERVRWRLWHNTEARWVWVESSPALLRDPATQAVTGYLDVIRDVTAQKEQEDALGAAKLAAEEAMHSKEHFLANMSHELRTPLNSIIGFSRLLDESGGLGPEVQRRVGLVHSAGLALHAVIDNVLDFSKLEADKLVLDCSPFNVDAFFTNTVSLLEPQAASRDVRLHVDVDPHVPARLVGDAGRLRQILLNLLSNAVKFTQNGSVTTKIMLVEHADRKARLRIEVVDTGGGIPEDKLATLFNRFVQANASVSRHYGGTGLGLAISRQLVSLMGGEIGVTSEVGTGSTFWFEITLPIADALDGSEHEVSAPGPLSLSGKRILVVDDVDLNRELMLALLSPYGCTVQLAEDGLDALKALETQSFDLVLMDCQMPVMDGFAATRAIRQQTGATAKMPIVALTASAQPQHLARCRAAGMNEHLTKPLSPNALEEVLQRYLGETAESEPEPEPKAAPQTGLSLRERYAIRRTATLEALDALIRAGRFTDTEVSEVANMAHNLAGTAGMFGEAELGDAAAALDAGIGLWSMEDRAQQLRASSDTMHQLVRKTA
ncbi:PAS domain S-box protein [Sphingomonas endolithica]|uniref:PAS domain S-box protein n=1 Tax=Sphingomonas endolithica TaxID=2972485 RepID=UPI0021B03055|nr:PAS domain S-box protein [Sphingomonas sp. ZFBP2030]